MYETLIPKTGSSDVFTADNATGPLTENASMGVDPEHAVEPSVNGGRSTLPNPVSNDRPATDANYEEYEWADNDGETYMVSIKGPVTGRNQTGQTIAETRGYIANFKG